MDKYKQDFALPYYMVDCSSRLRPSSFLDIAQELAALGAEPLGFADHHLEKYGIVWVLARMKARFDSYPRRLETVGLETWHRGAEGLFFLRDYRLLGSDGRPQILATSSWILMDTASRRALRTDRLGDIIPLEPQCPEAALDEPAPKIVSARDAAFRLARTQQVQYSDLDPNGHVNNVRYTVWALDALPMELMRSREVREICINFNREARPGDAVELWTLEEGDAWTVEGRLDGQQVFIERILF